MAEPPDHGAAFAEHLDAQPTTSPAVQPSSPTPGEPYAGQTRARIGVWRT
ncbi:hypothetical protein E4N62_32955 [Streptomyces sp. MNU76]|nr:hypothetical protein [Streptomyces sp. MNU76]MCC9709649.1 hypothetical protein [Streptomyces sp. MNU76]